MTDTMTSTAPESAEDTALANRQRRILYRAQHRGMKEADVLIGGYASRSLPEMDAPAMDLFESLLDELDMDIMDWVYDRKPTPEQYAGLVRQMLAEHDPEI
ncbi:MAG: succinate dehydrogenase assembly factor 2 [Rhodospirillaceae bacterium]